MIYRLSFSWCIIFGINDTLFKRRRSPQKLPQFREQIANSMILCRALRELFPSWSLTDGQALRSWILSMPASIRGRLDLLPEEYLRQFCAAHPPLPSVASVRTQTIRLCMPHAPRATLSASAVAEAVTAALSPAAPTGAEAAAAAPPPTPPGAASASQPVVVSTATSVATATAGRPVVQVAPSQPLFTPALPFGEP